MTLFKQVSGGEKAGFSRHIAVLALVTMASACGSDSTPSAGDGSETTQITVLAAASLTDSFKEIATDFEAAHPGTAVVLSFASSSALALQVHAGSPAQVLATADLSSMRAIDGLDTVGTPEIFAGNDLVIAVAAGNPVSITSLADLTAPGLLVSRCAPAVPCGKLADAALATSGITIDGASEAPDVKAAFAPLVAGQVDAALVYRSDVQSATGIDLVDLPADQAQRTGYFVVTLDGSTAAREFVDYVLSDAGTVVLTEHGFTQP